jgi:hypothetical protein
MSLGGRTYHVEMGIIALGVGVSLALLPRFQASLEQGRLTACKSNLKNIGTAAEMYATEHQGHYPKSLDQLFQEGQDGNLLYLRNELRCPSDTHAEYLYRMHPPPAGATFEIFEVHCSAGPAHRLPYGQPGYNSEQGLTEGATPERPGYLATLWAMAKDAPQIMTMGMALVFFLGSLAMRPDPPALALAILERSRALSWLSSLSWGLLVSGTVAGLMWASASLPFPLFRLFLSTLLCGTLAHGLVHLGWWVWQKLSPAETPASTSGSVGARPALNAEGNIAVLVPSTSERALETTIRIGLPAFAGAMLVGLPALEGDPMDAFRLSMLGLGSAALVCFPTYLWAKAWAATLTRRELEWIPGTDQLLEHRWDGRRRRILGTLAQVESVKEMENGYLLAIAGQSFHLSRGELGRYLASAVATR